MSKQLLYDANIIVCLEQVGSEGVAEGVGSGSSRGLRVSQPAFAVEIKVIA